MKPNSKAKRSTFRLKQNPELRNLLIVPFIFFAIKLLIIFNIPGGAWLGADGDSYIKGANSLLTDGLLSKQSILSYWPAGYPIFIWALAKIVSAHAIILLSILQSLFYAYSSYFFIKYLRATKLKQYTNWIAFVLAIDPTLSLSSLAVGYESPIASCMLITSGLILKSWKENESNNSKPKYFSIVFAGLIFAAASAMQPRWMLITIVTALIWAFWYKRQISVRVFIVIGVVGVMCLAPLSLIARNIGATNTAVISTNLGVTMNLGAGDGASGSYASKKSGVTCTPKAPASTVSDSELTKCVTTWYLTHPVKALHLFINKTIYFWSPWSGPLYNGTMGRNPWLKIDPVVGLARSSLSANHFVYGWFGKVLSTVWTACQLVFLFLGFYFLSRLGRLEKWLGWLMLSPVVISWAISLVTIGDNRFRLPTMPLSLTLQILGIIAAKKIISREDLNISDDHGLSKISRQKTLRKR